MILDLFSVFDRVAKEFNIPFPAKSLDIAKRMFQNALETNPFKNDMCLYHVGQFNTETGDIIKNNGAEFVCNYEEEVKNVEA